MSVHGTGRAVDIHIPLDDGEADNGLGDPIANYLVEHADEIGIQMVIWDRWMWSTIREPYSGAYGGSHPHDDHLHVELSPEAARMETPWFESGTPAPDLPDCDALGADGGIIDETSPCFVAFGASQYWRRVDNAGVAGSLLWTNVFQATSPSNWARWNVNLEAGGEYVVEYYRTPEYAIYDAARYEIRANGSSETVYLDQSAGDQGWQQVGTFEFAAGSDQWVSIYDDVDAEVPSGQRIVVDALRLRPVGQEPDDAEQPTNPNISQGDQRYGTTGDQSVPPKGSEGSPARAPGTPDDEDADLGYPVVNNAGGRVCSTSSATPGDGGIVALLAGLFAFGFARRR
jgi:MYXO-CTERM domain-containing protein